MRNLDKNEGLTVVYEEEEAEKEERGWCCCCRDIHSVREIKQQLLDGKMEFNALRHGIGKFWVTNYDALDPVEFYQIGLHPRLAEIRNEYHRLKTVIFMNMQQDLGKGKTSATLCGFSPDEIIFQRNVEAKREGAEVERQGYDGQAPRHEQLHSKTLTITKAKMCLLTRISNLVEETRNVNREVETHVMASTSALGTMRMKDIPESWTRMRLRWYQYMVNLLFGEWGRVPSISLTPSP